MTRNLLICAALLGGLTTPALAHVSLDAAEASVGATLRLTLRVPHGCGDEATHTLRVQIPAGLVNVQPMVKPGWATEAITADYPAPIVHRDAEIASGVTEIVWSGGDLPSAFYDEFVLRGAVASSLAPGERLFFPVVQECATAEALWLDVSGDHDVEGPAPFVTVVPGHAAGH